MFKGEALECVTIAALAPLGIPTVVAIVVRTCSVQLHLSIVGTCSSACIKSTSVAFHTGPFFSLHFFTVYQGLTVLLDVLLVLMVTLTMAHPCSPPRNNINVTNNDGGGGRRLLLGLSGLSVSFPPSLYEVRIGILEFYALSS